MAALKKGNACLAHVPYDHCRTKVVDLRQLNLPESAHDEVYRRIYHNYTQNAIPGSNAFCLRDAIESIKYGIAPPVAFPTETVYGLGADAFNPSAVSGIFAAKGRPNDNPLIAHVSSSEHLQRVIGGPTPDVYMPVIAKFWPGPLTILLPVPDGSKFAPNVHPGQSTIGFRMPSSPYARFFIAACDRPIAGPSANSSGKPSPTTAQHVMDDLHGKINFILDGGSCDVGVESTVVDGLHDPPLILRPGGVSLEELRSVGGKWAETAIGYESTHRHSPSNPSTPASDQYFGDMNGAPRAPGMKYRHYSPTARLVQFNHHAIRIGRVEEYLSNLIDNSHIQHINHEPTKNSIANQPQPLRIGMISWAVPPFFGIIPSSSSLSSPLNPSLDHEDIQIIKQSVYHPSISTTTYSNSNDNRNSDTLLINITIPPTIQALARELFGVLRLLDELKCDYIFAEMIERREAENGRVVVKDKEEESTNTNSSGELWDAVIDRLGKASSERIEG